MLEITIRGNAAEGKTRTAKEIERFWEEQGRKVCIIEGWRPGIDNIDYEGRGVEVLIRTIQEGT